MKMKKEVYKFTNEELNGIREHNPLLRNKTNEEVLKMIAYEEYPIKNGCFRLGEITSNSFEVIE